MINSTIIKLKEIVEGQKTYPSWSSSSTYSLNVEENGKSILIYYIIKTKKRISRIFPKEIILSPKLAYILGLLKGEGSNSLGKSNYRRLTITNSDPNIIKIILNGLEENSLFRKYNLPDKSIHLLHHTEADDEVINYWSNKLNIDKCKFKCFDDRLKTSKYGVCHVYISDVLLRRVIDILQDYIPT